MQKGPLQNELPSLQMLWLLLLTLVCLGASVPMTPAPGPETELVDIVGGHDAQPGKDEGSLIHVGVQVGQVKRHRSNLIQGVAHVIIHPNYNPQDATQGRDIALLKLVAPVKLSPTVQLVTLPRPRLRVCPGTKCMLTGWGDIRSGEPLPRNKNLQEVQVPIVDLQTCRKSYRRIKKYVSNNMLCAGSPWMTACYGDSGGPLVCPKGRIWVQVGVVSWGNPKCDKPGYPTVYTEVAFYMSWIRKYVQLPA
ncbi:mastin-like [Tenrec ecaudatus]|uniref:mastin-like n=1 Tax=Tenrec ecaudatus TaxID=94439 RepID=UPI003F590F63